MPGAPGQPASDLNHSRPADTRLVGNGADLAVGGVPMITLGHLTKSYRDERSGPTLRLIKYPTGYLGQAR